MHRDLNLELCRALAIDPRGVQRVTLNVCAGGPPTIAVQRLLTPTDLDRLATVVEMLELAPRARVIP